MTDIPRREILVGLGSSAAVLLTMGLPGFNVLRASAAVLEAESFESFESMLRALTDGEVEWLGEARLAPADSALHELYRLHGLRWEFSNRVDYDEADECTDNFRACEGTFRRNGSTYFTDVERSEGDSDISFMTAGRTDPTGRWSTIFGSTQFQEENPAIEMRGVQPGVVLAGARIFNEAYRASHAEYARATALVSAPTTSPAVSPGGSLARNGYMTPNVEMYHYPAPARMGSRRYTGGILGVRRRRSQDPFKFKGLYM